MRKVMVRAWEIAKEGAAKFGGTSKQYFRQSLIMAWREIKMEKANKYEVVEFGPVKGNPHFKHIGVNYYDGMTAYLLSGRVSAQDNEYYARIGKINLGQQVTRYDNDKPGALLMVEAGVKAIELVHDGETKRITLTK